MVSQHASTRVKILFFKLCERTLTGPRRTLRHDPHILCTTQAHHACDRIERSFNGRTRFTTKQHTIHTESDRTLLQQGVSRSAGPKKTGFPVFFPFYQPFFAIASSAAATCASCLLIPFPFAIRSFPKHTPTSKVFSWSGPSSESTLYDGVTPTRSCAAS